jgi:ADP-ribose pyrophosphatase YjhB (NUDIX family)
MSKNYDVSGNSIVQVVYSLSQQNDSQILSFVKSLTPKHYGELYFFLHFTESKSRVHDIMSTWIFSEGRESLYGVTGIFRLHEIFSQIESGNPCFELPDIWSQACGIVTLKKREALTMLYNVVRCRCPEHEEDNDRRCFFAGMVDDKVSFDRMLEELGSGEIGFISDDEAFDDFNIGTHMHILSSDYPHHSSSDQIEIEQQSLVDVHVSESHSEISLEARSFFSCLVKEEKKENVQMSDVKDPIKGLKEKKDLLVIPEAMECPLVPICDSESPTVTPIFDVRELPVEKIIKSYMVPLAWVISPLKEARVIAWTSTAEKEPLDNYEITIGNDELEKCEALWVFLSREEVRMDYGAFDYTIRFPVGRSKIHALFVISRKSVDTWSMYDAPWIVTSLSAGDLFTRAHANRKLCKHEHKHHTYAIHRPPLIEAYDAGMMRRHKPVGIDQVEFLDSQQCVLYTFGLAGYPPNINLVKLTNEWIVGAKIIFYTKRGLYLFKDRLKPLDLIGGHVEPGESPVTTVRREFQEETGRKLTAKFKFGFCTAEKTSSAHYLSYVFLSRGKPSGQGWYYCPYGLCPLVVVPWLKRHLRAWSYYVVFRIRARYQLEATYGFI